MKTSHKVSRVVVHSIICVLVAGVISLAGIPATAEPLKQQVLVDEARITVDNFVADPDMTWFLGHAEDAKGLFIVPSLLKAAFIFGGSGGRGVLLVRDEKTGKWSEPAFYNMGSVSWGLQVGAKKSEVIMMVMTQRGLESLYTSSFKLGGNVSVAAGPVGSGVEGATAPSLKVDYISFARSKGAFIGLSLDGAIIKTNDDWNNAYYDKPVRPVDILVTHNVSNPKSAELRKAVSKVVKR
jgi:lipid-binding SYLF domain-containing protein